MQIEVTQKDIEDGLPGRSLHCPVALAIWRVMMAEAVVSHRADHWPSDVITFANVVAGRSQIKLRIGFEEFEFDTPGTVQTFMRKFDNQEKVEPLTFDLAPFNPFVLAAGAEEGKTEKGQEPCQA